jgi:hypothetical protein
MPARRILFWTVLASLGIGLAAGLTIATSELARQPIGLASEPLTAGDQLAPPAARAVPVRHASSHHRRKHRRVHSVVTHLVPPVAPVIPAVARAAPTAPAATTVPTVPAATVRSPRPASSGRRSAGGEHDGGDGHDDSGGSSSSDD